MSNKIIKCSLAVALLMGIGCSTYQVVLANDDVESTILDSLKADFHRENIVLNNQGLDITSDLLPVIKGDTQTFIIKFKSNNNNALQALLGISNKATGYRNNYFDIFMRDTGELGVELRNAESNTNYLFSRPASLWGKNQQNQSVYNSIAFVSDVKTKTYSLFANGTKVYTKKVDDFKAIRDIVGINSVYLGGVNREGSIAFNFSGEIADVKMYNSALSDQQLENLTANEVKETLIFKSNDETGSNYFRIPSLYTLSNGRVFASVDARYGGTHDFLNKINIATSYSDDNGKTWSTPKLTLSFEDFANVPLEWPREPGLRDMQVSGGATYIDSVLLEDPSNSRFYLMADVMPAGIGFREALRNDSGFKQINGKYYLKLKKNGDSKYNYTIRENGVIYDDTTNKPTEYSVDDSFGLKQNGTYLQVEQYSAKFENGKKNEYKNGIMVNMNIFYKDSLFKVTPTNYLAYITSDDFGENWSHPVLLPPLMGLNRNSTYLGPGKGLVVSTTGRLIFPSYTGKEVVYIYSDDHGKTWQSKVVPVPNGWSAEAQLVELSPGVLQSYMRTNNGKIAYMTSTDGGDSWNKPQFLSFIANASYGTQLNVINYSQKIDGKNVIMLSTPNATNGRRNGQIWIGLINEDNSINWKYHKDVDYSQYGFSYSALEELPNHNVGLFFEKFDSWSRNELHMKNVTPFISYTLDELLNR